LQSVYYISNNDVGRCMNSNTTCLPALAAPPAAAEAGSSSEDEGVTSPCASVILQLSV